MVGAHGSNFSQFCQSGGSGPVGGHSREKWIGLLSKLAQNGNGGRASGSSASSSATVGSSSGWGTPSGRLDSSCSKPGVSAGIDQTLASMI